MGNSRPFSARVWLAKGRLTRTSPSSALFCSPGGLHCVSKMSSWLHGNISYLDFQASDKLLLGLQSWESPAQLQGATGDSSLTNSGTVSLAAVLVLCVAHAGTIGTKQCWNLRLRAGTLEQLIIAWSPEWSRCGSQSEIDWKGWWELWGSGLVETTYTSLEVGQWHPQNLRKCSQLEVEFLLMKLFEMGEPVINYS